MRRERTKSFLEFLKMLNKKQNLNPHRRGRGSGGASSGGLGLGGLEVRVRLGDVGDRGAHGRDAALGDGLAGEGAGGELKFFHFEKERKRETEGMSAKEKTPGNR